MSGAFVVAETAPGLNTKGVLRIQIAFETARLDYDAKALRALPFRVEPTQYPPGFRIPKKGLAVREYVQAISEVLYLVG
ncbi:hypothetical protein [Meiothermus sp. QL-1]|uniref:hypothetical protein n=1 Tax=Meiothermus sp. QL-1 TaxID=2058095 RepID=UPI001F288B01|nr:hypothetical protein [Meiothermus sp. QL-1]